MPDIEDLAAIAGTSVADGDLLHLIDITAADVDPKDKQLTVEGLRDGYLLTGFRKIDATVAPGVSNDDTEGYQVGSAWFDVTNDKAYICVDASTGAAVWLGLGTAATPTETVVLSYALGDETTSLTTGTAKLTSRAPFAFTLTDVRGSLVTVATGATLVTVDVNESGTTVLSTKLTFDASELTTTTAATPMVISDSAIADDAELTFDIDAIGNSTPGVGLKVTLIGTKP